MEEQLIRSAMERAGGKVSQAARLLDIKRTQLAYRLKKLKTDEVVSLAWRVIDKPTYFLVYARRLAG